MHTAMVCVLVIYFFACLFFIINQGRCRILSTSEIRHTNEQMIKDQYFFSLNCGTEGFAVHSEVR